MCKQTIVGAFVWVINIIAIEKVVYRWCNGKKTEHAGFDMLCLYKCLCNFCDCSSPIIGGWKTSHNALCHDV